MTEAPRGALAHWIVIKDGKIDNYQLVVPSTWNASPRDAKGQRSAYEAALIGTPVANPEQPLEILRTIHSFDPVHRLRRAPLRRARAARPPGPGVLRRRPWQTSRRSTGVYVWELPVRLYHWVNALCVVVLCVTGYLIGKPLAHPASRQEASFSYWFGTVRFIHFVAAFVFFFNFLFRIYWGFVGNRTPAGTTSSRYDRVQPVAGDRRRAEGGHPPGHGAADRVDRPQRAGRA